MSVTTIFQLAGAVHLLSLAAIIFAPIQLRWDEELARLPKLLRQMCQVYNYYTGATIAACGGVSILCADELAQPTKLSCAVCVYIALFWAVRLGLQVYYDFRPYLTNAFLRLSYHALTFVFIGFAGFYGWAAWR